MPRRQPAKAQNADGTPHYCYLDPETLYSFAWDGISEHIEVISPNEGEVIDEIPTRIAILAIDTAVGWQNWFRSTCDAWITIKRNL